LRRNAFQVSTCFQKKNAYFEGIASLETYCDTISCASGVAGPFAEGGRYGGSLGHLEPIDRIEVETRYIAEYVDDQFERPFPDVIPFAQLGSGGWTCLNYQNDPTCANPEVWEGNMETNAPFETFFHKIADSFDDFIDMLLPDDKIAALGFR